MEKTFVMMICLVTLCCCNEKSETYPKQRISSFINHLKDNDIDTLLFSQDFFNEDIRLKKDRFQLYLESVKQMKELFRNAESIDVHALDLLKAKLSDDFKNKAFVIIINTHLKKDSICILADDYGIKSFVVMKKGDHITWL